MTNPKEFLYVRATVADIEHLVSSRIQVLKTVFHSNELEDMSEIESACAQYYREALTDGTHTAYLVLDGEKVIGTGGICYYRVMPMPYDKTGRRAFIMNMYTDEGYRKKGIAGKILELLIEDAKQKGITQIFLSATEMGKPVYEKYGFSMETGAMKYSAP